MDELPSSVVLPEQPARAAAQWPWWVGFLGVAAGTTYLAITTPETTIDMYVVPTFWSLIAVAWLIAERHAALAKVITCVAVLLLFGAVLTI